MTWPNYGWWPMDVFAWLLFSTVVASLLYLVVTVGVCGVCGVLWARERVAAWRGARHFEPPRQPLERMIDLQTRHPDNPGGGVCGPGCVNGERHSLRKPPAPTSIPGDGEPRE